MPSRPTIAESEYKNAWDLIEFACYDSLKFVLCWNDSSILKFNVFTEEIIISFLFNELLQQYIWNHLLEKRNENDTKQGEFFQCSVQEISWGLGDQLHTSFVLPKIPLTIDERHLQIVLNMNNK